jgi:hypothetical protein
VLHKLFKKAMLTNGMMFAGLNFGVSCFSINLHFAFISFTLYEHFVSLHQQPARYGLHKEPQSNNIIFAFDYLHIAGIVTPFSYGDNLIKKMDGQLFNHKHPAYLGISACMSASNCDVLEAFGEVP